MVVKDKNSALSSHGLSRVSYAISRKVSRAGATKELYNLLLERSIRHYEATGRTPTRYSIIRMITQLKREHPSLREVYSQVLQNVADRLSKAYANFFRRIKEKKAGKSIKAGFPRFKKYVRSLTYPQSGFEIQNGKRVRLANIGAMPLILHRLPEGKIKTFTIKKAGSGKWFAFFSCEQEERAFKPNGKPKTGIDVGIKSFVATAEGKLIDNPKYLSRSSEKLAMLQRRVSRKKKGGRNRRKAIIRLARGHELVASQRNDFLHKLSHRFVNSYSYIAHEDLNIRGMVKNHCLARSINDASWASFLSMLGYKASSAGCQVIGVDTRGTSQTCSMCGNKEDIDLSVRVFNCSKCGLKLDRDINASRNILNTVGQTGINACAGYPAAGGRGPPDGDLAPTPGAGASHFDEAGTTRGEIASTDAGSP